MKLNPCGRHIYLAFKISKNLSTFYEKSYKNKK